MKRKVIQIAGKTFVVSLPNKWVKEWGVKKGEELDLVEDGPRLSISTVNSKDVKKGSVDVSGASERVLRWVLSSLHKKGYDEIEVISSNPEHAVLIDELLKDLFMGFAVVHRSGNRCIVRALSRELDDQFDVILRRAFLVTLDFGEKLLERLKERKGCSDLVFFEKTNNQLTNFCERILNKRGHVDPVSTNFLYVIVWNLEKVADEYKYICNKAKSLNSGTLSVFEKVNSLVRSYYELFYKFDLSRLNVLADEQKVLRGEIDELMVKCDAVVLSHLSHIVLKCADFSASIFALNN